MCVKYVGVGQNRIYTPYITVYLLNILPKTPYIQRIYVVLANPISMQVSLDGRVHAHFILTSTTTAVLESDAPNRHGYATMMNCAAEHDLNTDSFENG